MEVQRREILEELMTLQHRMFQELLKSHFKLMEAHIDVFGRHPFTHEASRAVNRTNFEEKFVLNINDRAFSNVVLDFCDDFTKEDGSCAPTSFVHLLDLAEQSHASFLPGDKMRVCFIIERSFEVRSLTDTDRKVLCDAYQNKIPLLVEWCRPPPPKYDNPLFPESSCVSVVLKLLAAGPPPLPEHKAAIAAKLQGYLAGYPDALRPLGERTLKKILE
ncbi:hypothetical protein ACHHYP_14501 [Achlya hypogyna]|uniref:Uncharacterized protein n=1 Tax=Achlya hypogyna TaxID=1202772 RepID=A0A1V9YD25_ACHHY|nr:hypothetical protein ACHHYP_14501 [Achlya hypogyna]